MKPRRPAVVLVLALVLVSLASTARAQAAPQAPLTRGETEAEMILRLLPLVSWPSASFASAKAPLTICLVGSDPFGTRLSAGAAQAGVNGHPIALRRVSDLATLAGCHVVFIAQSEDKRLGDILAATASSAVLTIGDTAGFGARGVQINFYLQANPRVVRFEANLAAVHQSGLVLSNRILRLARVKP